jgi:hypothetical protein
MTTFLLRIPQTMMDQVNELCHEYHVSKSAFLRQSVLRNIDVHRTVEGPAVREHFRKRIPNLHLEPGKEQP